MQTRRALRTLAASASDTRSVTVAMHLGVWLAGILNEQWSDALESLDSADQSLWKLTRRVMRVLTPSPPLLVPGGLALSDFEKQRPGRQP
jgi:hypothetical protein